MLIQIFLDRFLRFSTAMARTLKPLLRNCLSIFSTNAFSSRQYGHHVVQNSSRTTFPFTDASVFRRKRGVWLSSSPAKATTANKPVTRMARNYLTARKKPGNVGDPHRPDIRRRSPRCDRKAKEKITKCGRKINSWSDAP